MNGSLTDLVAQIDRTAVERRFEWAAIPEGWTALLMLAVGLFLCWAVVMMYRREGRKGATPGVRAVLATIRCAVILVLAAIWLQPVLATYLHRWIDSYCLVLLDDSSSMDLGDRYRAAEDAIRVDNLLGPGSVARAAESGQGIRRMDLVTRLIERDEGGFFRDLSNHNRIKVYSFSSVLNLLTTIARADEVTADSDPIEPADETPATADTDPTATDAGNFKLHLPAQGAATNASRAVRRAIELLGGAPLAGVVLLSDGGFNQGDPIEELARFIQERNVPIHVVGVGDASPPQNVRVTEISAPDNAFKADPIAIIANLTSQGMAGETIRVELYERSESDPADRPVESRTVTLSGDGPMETVQFSRTRDQLGPVTYRVAVPVGPFESVTDDNAKQAVVNVMDDKMRVLLIAGSPSWEYRYLSRLLMRDATFDVSCWLQSAAMNAVRDGNTIIDQLPSTPEELFVYDAVILIDPDSTEFGPGWSQSLETLITDHGGGLLYAASRKYTQRFMRDPAVEPIVRMLPVNIDPEADLILNRIGYYQTRGWPLDVPDETTGHALFRAFDNQMDARAYWSKLQGVYWHYPVLREKPAATVLFRHSNPQMRNSYGSHVLAATQFMGAGRSAFLAFDSTWRWRGSGEDAFNSFWVPTLRFLVEGKLLGGRKRVMLITEGTTFQLGRAIDVSAHLFDSRFEPLQEDSVTANYRAGTVQQPVILRRSLDRPGWFEGRFTPSQTGDYEIELTLPAHGTSDAVTATQYVEVVRPNIEIANPQMNRAALQMLAERSAAGGYYEIDEAHSIPAAIPDRHESTTVKSRPIPLWDNQWTLIGLIGALCMEWAIRKWARLL